MKINRKLAPPPIEGAHFTINERNRWIAKIWKIIRVFVMFVAKTFILN